MARHYGERLGARDRLMRGPPPGFDENALAHALSAGWGVSGLDHWMTSDRTHRLFVTVQDLEESPSLGGTLDQVFAKLCRALETSVALRYKAQLELVVVPIRASEGALALRVDRRYAVIVFPYLVVGPLLTPAAAAPVQERRLVAMLVELRQRA